MPVMVNQVYDILEPKVDTARIIALLEDDRVILISLIKTDTLPYEHSLKSFVAAVEQGDAVINYQFPSAFCPSPTEKQLLAAQKAWEVIGPFVQDEPHCYDQKIRSRFIASKSKETGLQRKQIQRLLYKFWAGGMTQYALYPDYAKRGGPGKPRKSETISGRPVLHEVDNHRRPLTPQDINNIKKAIEKYYNRQYGYSIRNAYKMMLSDHYTDPATGFLVESYPTETQFRYHAEKFIDIKKRAGSIIYNKDLRGITGSSKTEARGPGDVYQIDATLADIYLVSRYNRQEVVGRPELYFVTDVFSRMIVGFYTCLESASWENARYALLNAFNDKVEFCRRYDVTICSDDWPCCGLPRALIVDNGELISKKSNMIIKNLNIEVKNAPAWRPDLKGIVENKFHLLGIDLRQRLPGSVQPDFKTRTGQDYRLDACLDINEFTQILIQFVLQYNRREMSDHPQALPDVLADSVPPIPLELWHWGIANRTGALRQDTPENLEIALSEDAEVSVTRKGVSFKRMFYSGPTAERENWFSKAREKGSWKINIKYRPEDTSIIYWLDRFGRYERLTRTGDSALLYPGMTLAEIEYEFRKAASQHSELQSTHLQNAIDYQRKVDSIVEKALAKKNNLTMNKTKNSTKNIKENRKKEAASIRAEQQASQGIPKVEPKAEVIDFHPKKSYNYASAFATFQDEDDE